MSRFDMNWRKANKGTKLPRLNPFRQRFGLRWQKSYPTADDFDTLANWVTAAVVVVLLFVTYGFVDANDQALVARTEAREASQKLADLLNGATLTDQAQTVAVKCLQVLDVTL